MSACLCRVVGAADSQLFILRMQVCALCEPGGELRRRGHVFGRADLEAGDGADLTYPDLP